MEQATTWWQVLVTIAGAFGGLEFIKWVFNRKTNSRIALAEAESAEFHHLQETNEWLQKQLQAKEERFADQTQLVRKQNTEILDVRKEMAEKDLSHAKEIAALELKMAELVAAHDLELAKKKCEDIECPFRRPPNAYTPPKPGLTKEQYHQQKLLPQ